MTIRFSNDLERTLHRALEASSHRSHEYATLEHLLFALLDDPVASACMRSCQVDIDEMKLTVDQFLNTEYATMVSENVDPQPTAGFQRVIQRSILHAQSLNSEEVDGGRVIVALFSERDSYAVYFLQQQGMSRLDAISYLSDEIGGGDSSPDYQALFESEPDWQSDFFVSYSGDDEEIAREVVSVLEAFGFKVIAQFKDFKTGSNFVTQMQNALSNSLRVISLYSDSYFKSEHCQAEWAAAYNQDPSGRRGTLLPLLVSPSELTPLAKTIVYTSLVGKDRQQRALAIVRAVQGDGYQTPIARPKLEAIIDRTVSPDLQIDKSRISILPNIVVDSVVDYPVLIESGKSLIEMSEVILENLPANSPPIVASCIQKYRKHLIENRRRPISGLINALSAAIEREVFSPEADIWDSGVGSLLKSFLGTSEKLVSSLKGEVEQDKIIRAVSIASEDVDKRFVSNSLSLGQAALESLVSEGLGTEEFNDYVRQQGEILRSSDFSAPTDDQIRKGFFARFVINSVGFYRKVVDVASSSASLLDSPAARSAVDILRRVAKSLVDLFV